MRYRALVFILLAACAIPAEAAQPVAVVLSQPIGASEAKGAKELASHVQRWADGVASGRGAEDVFATAPWDEERRP